MNPKLGRSTDQVRADIKVKVLPRSSANQIVGREEGVFKVKLTAPPVEGKANKALKEFLAKRLGLPKSDVEIVSGERSRLKSVLIHGLSLKEVDALLKS
ncbi:MAG: YggU family protein [Deltaproteobacteria bacterium]|nr:YggU family protein [Deltaproteobacteria bacterium]